VFKKILLAALAVAVVIVAVMFFFIGNGQPDTFNFDLEAHGEPKVIQSEGGAVQRQMEFYGLGDYSRLDGVNSLEYKTAHYDLDGAWLYTIRTRMSGIGSNIYYLRLDDVDTNYSTIYNYVQGVAWRRGDAEESFSVLADKENFSLIYGDLVSEINMYLDAINAWDGEGLIITPLTPAETKAVIFGIKFNPALDGAVFRPEQD
jgi:hypothetical protein